MSIKSVSIAALFGTFDHEIPLFHRDPITIVHGPNGVGKTSILRLVYGALRPAYSHLRHIPFRKLSIAFDDGMELSVTPTRPEEGAGGRARSFRSRPHARLAFRLTRSDGTEEEFNHPGTAHHPRLDHRIDLVLPHLRRVGPDEWFDTHIERVLTLEDVLQLYGSDLPEELRPPEGPEWLRDIQRRTPVHFIETQRLLDTKPPSRPHQRTGPQQSAVKRCSSEFADHIKSTLATSATLSQGLERTFPARLISQAGPVPMTESEIREKLAELDKHRSRLVEAGLLDRGHELPLPTKRFDETTQRVLAVYIRDTEQKLSVFDGILERIELIKSIVDSRFLQKSLAVDREEGFVVKARDGRSVELSDLSSGEQHELVLLYELLFRAEPGTLILIDEPELSLHIAWQQQFLRDLLRITRLAKLQALVATHSPQIIHDRWDLTVELLGPSR